MMFGWKIAVLALGSNLGDRGETLHSAIEQLGSHPKIRVLEQSPLVESVAVTESGLDESKPNYLNGVVKIATKLSPRKLLEATSGIELSHGRVRERRWESRSLDIDIITYENTKQESKNLTLPHPRAHERAFVLVPWLLMDAEAELVGFGKVSELAEPIKNQVWLQK
jgi:2-amino-4-hydroxy-6-hydroxymethyldihydropteridine diphosphokinase